MSETHCYARNTAGCKPQLALIILDFVTATMTCNSHLVDSLLSSQSLHVFVPVHWLINSMLQNNEIVISFAFIDAVRVGIGKSVFKRHVRWICRLGSIS